VNYLPLLLPLFLLTSCDGDNDPVPTCETLQSFGPEVLQFTDPGLATVSDLTFGPEGIVATGRIDRSRLHLTQFTPDGEIAWTKDLGIDSGESIKIIPVSSGGYLVGGRTLEFGSITQFLAIRTDAEGEELWTSGFGDSGVDNAAGLEETSNGGYMIFGTTSLTNTAILNNLFDLRLVNLDDSGTERWSRTFDLTLKDNALAFTKPTQAEEKYWGLISTLRDGSIFQDLTLLEFSAEGQERARIPLGITSQEIWSPNAIHPTADGGAIIGITTKENDAQGVPNEATLIKLNPAGTVEWTQRYSAIRSSLSAVIQNADGGYTFFGNKPGYRQDVSVLFVVNTDDRGTIRWCREFSMTDYGAAGDLVQLPDGGYLLTGLASDESAPFIHSLWTLRLDENGLPLI